MSYVFCLMYLSLGIFGLLGFFRYLSTLLNEEDENKDVLSAIAALLLTPVAASMFLWIAMVLFPGKFSLQTLGFSIIAFYALLTIIFEKNAVAATKSLWCRYVSFWRDENIIWGIPLGIAAVVMMLLFSGVLASNISVQNFDIIEYVIGGDHFANTRSIIYNGYFINEKNGFIYFTYHSFCMPLFATLGVFFYETSGMPQDWYIKFLNGYFLLTLNIMTVFFLFHRKKERSWIFPICGIILLNAIPIVGDRLISFGIDFFRIACLTAGIGTLWQLLKNPSVFKGILSVFLLAAAASAHLLGACIVPFLCLLPLGMQATWRKKIIYTLTIGLSVLLIGYCHYFLQILYGDGWIFAKPSELTSTHFPVFQEQTVLQQIMNGYFGVLFNFKFYSFSSVTAVILFLSTLKKHKFNFTVEHKFFFVFLFISALLIALRGYANYRYSYTIFYLIVLSAFACVLKADENRCIHFMALSATILTVFYSVWVMWLHIYDINKYINTVQNTKQIPQKFCSIGELFDTLQKEKKSRVGLWSKNKALMRNAPVPLCYISRDCLINWLEYSNEILPIKYSPLTDTFESIVRNNFSHILLDKRINQSVNQSILKDATSLCETENYILFRLKSM